MKQVIILTLANSISVHKIIGFIYQNLELLFWIMVLMAFITINPYQEQYFTLCPIKNITGYECMGCSLGHSIASLMRFDLITSLDWHYLGLPALLAIFYRIFLLFKNIFQPKTYESKFGGINTWCRTR